MAADKKWIVVLYERTATDLLTHDIKATGSKTAVTKAWREEAKRRGWRFVAIEPDEGGNE